MRPRLHLCDAMPDSARGMASQRCSFFSLPRNERAGGRVGLVGKTQHRGPRVRACRSIADMSSSSSSWRHIKLEGCGNTECHCELLGLGGARQVERERELRFTCVPLLTSRLALQIFVCALSPTAPLSPLAMSCTHLRLALVAVLALGLSSPLAAQLSPDCGESSKAGTSSETGCARSRSWRRTLATRGMSEHNGDGGRRIAQI